MLIGKVEHSLSSIYLLVVVIHAPHAISTHHPTVQHTGFPFTEENVCAVLEMSDVHNYKDRAITQKCFELAENDFNENIMWTQIFPKKWLAEQKTPEWWRLGMKLIRCCNKEEVMNVHELMKNIVNFNQRGMLL